MSFKKNTMWCYYEDFFLNFIIMDYVTRSLKVFFNLDLGSFKERLIISSTNIKANTELYKRIQLSCFYY